MKKTLSICSILISFATTAQSIEINANGGTANASAILDLKSTTKGFLLPRMTNAQMRAIPNPAQGLLAFCTDCGTNGDYYFYKGTAWVALSSTTATGSTTVGTVGDNATENGATITNGVLSLAPANASYPGIVTIGAQTIGGVKTFSNGIVGNITGNVTGNAATVTTNANLTGVVTSNGNVTSIANGTITNAMLANGAVANLSGTNSGDQTLPTLSSLGAVASNSAITGATNTKITYDSKGLVTAGTAATTADIAASTNKNYVTDAQQIVINNTSGTNTGDQTLPTLSSLGAVASNSAITGATNTKITYDSKGLVIAGAAATTADIAASTNKNYVTDAQQIVINNTSGTNTGDQTLPTLSSLGAVASNSAITGATNTKITYDAKGLVTAGTAATTADIAASTNKNYITDAQQIVINNTSGTNTGDNAVNSLYSGLVTNATHTGDVIGSIALTIANDAVTTAKIAAGAITDLKVADVAASKITGILTVVNGGTGTTNGSITGTGALTFAAGGSNQNISISPSGTGSVGIGTSSPNTSAALDVTSTTKGFLPPRMTYAQRQAISFPPATGLMVYCTNCGVNGGEPQFYNGNGWVNMIGGTALVPIPNVAATTVTNITNSTYTIGGNIIDDGGSGSVITARGVCWSTTQNPTIADSKTTVDGTTGIYTSNITGLTALTTYYVRAYATNASGTAYGTEINFTSNLDIGSLYQGGIVYYVFQPNDPGYVVGQIHGLIVSPNDQGSAIWSSYTDWFWNNTSTALGSGMGNTNTIIALNRDAIIAASIARSYQGGGYTDWYLPSVDEINLLNATTLFSSSNQYYWTSSERNSVSAWFRIGNAIEGTNKRNSIGVRAIRTF